MPAGPCLLCGRDAELQLSHVLPAFVFRWLRESSGNGFIRRNRTPNRRIQDGEKRYWLCVDCEQLFGGWEKSFAERLFQPYLKSSGEPIGYAHWLMRFCVSVSWRVLQYFKEHGVLKALEPHALAHVERAEEAWRDYLLGRRKRPGEFEMHLLPLDRIESATMPLVPQINRYLMRACHMDFLQGKDAIFTYAKMGRFIVIGMIHEPNKARWKGTKVDPVSGMIRPREYELPASLLEYLKEKAQHTHAALASVSPKQRQKIDEAFRANIDQLAKSDAFVAMNADVEMFGDDAFGVPEEGPG
jgi:hypothetical protein